MPQPLWTPSAERIRHSRMEAFRQYVNRQYQLNLADYSQLHAWSIDRRADFDRVKSNVIRVI